MQSALVERTRERDQAQHQMGALSNLLRAISNAPFELLVVLEAIAQSSAELCEADDSTIFLRREDELGDAFFADASWGTSAEFRAFMAANPRRLWHKSLVPKVVNARSIVHIPDKLLDPDYTFPGATQTRLGSGLSDSRALLGIPMYRNGVIEGVFSLTRREPTAFSDKQIKMVEMFADQALVAIEHARLFDEVQCRTHELSRSLEELRKAQDRLIQAEKLASLGQLTAGIAHEIKNPLNFVNNFSALSGELVDELRETLGSAPLDVRTREEVDEVTQLLKGNLEKIVQHGRRADSIVRNMLLHSRTGSGEHRLVDLNALIDESLNLAYHGARAAEPDFNVSLHRDLDPATGLVDLYPQEISRVLLNLIANGFHAIAKRRDEGVPRNYEPCLAVATRDRGDQVELRVRDNGTGISDSVKARMFDPFFTTKPAGEGTGLGLSLSFDSIVKQHGGTIDVATELGHFTEFTIVLPRSSRDIT
ncbi:ATP-binding protein [Methylobacterium durans]|uniref:ATP-binding protein n=1 Tax=Methylobacterium durans TaxID=2202825 RepID=UPI001F33362D|nr:ATP-binding protein [Methylobacterium durans]